MQLFKNSVCIIAIHQKFLNLYKIKDSQIAKKMCVMFYLRIDEITFHLRNIAITVLNRYKINVLG